MVWNDLWGTVDNGKSITMPIIYQPHVDYSNLQIREKSSIMKIVDRFLLKRTFDDVASGLLTNIKESNLLNMNINKAVTLRSNGTCQYKTLSTISLHRQAQRDMRKFTLCNLPGYDATCYLATSFVNHFKRLVQYKKGVWIVWM